MEKAPDAFRTISEVADDLDIPQHVLRFWESRFTQIKPMKRGGGRRYYRPDDVALLRGIRHLLYGQGYTIRGVKQILSERGVRFVQTVWETGAEQPLRSDEDAEGEIVPDMQSAIDISRPAAHVERREPTFAAPIGPAAADPRPQGAPASIDRQPLSAALDELAECRRILDAAMSDPA